MLATGGSIIEAIKELKTQGYRYSRREFSRCYGRYKLQLKKFFLQLIFWWLLSMITLMKKAILFLA
jgi:hypothetical protein